MQRYPTRKHFNNAPAGNGGGGSFPPLPGLAGAYLVDDGAGGFGTSQITQGSGDIGIGLPVSISRNIRLNSVNHLNNQGRLRFRGLGGHGDTYFERCFATHFTSEVDDTFDLAVFSAINANEPTAANNSIITILLYLDGINSDGSEAFSKTFKTVWRKNNAGAYIKVYEEVISEGQDAVGSFTLSTVFSSNSIVARLVRAGAAGSFSFSYYRDIIIKTFPV